MRALILSSLSSVVLFGCDSSSSSRSNPPADVPAAPDAPVAGETPKPIESPKPNPDDPTQPDQPAPVPGALVEGLRLSRAELFQGVGSGVARKSSAFSDAAARLAQAVAVYCSDPSANDRTPVQQSWKTAMLLWEELEVLQIGPIGANEKLLKTGIYGWPQLPNTCKIDEEALKTTKTATYTLPPNGNRKGLQAIDYLLHESSLLSSCSATIASKKEWDALPADVRLRARCSYLKPLLAELQINAAAVSSAWGTPEKNYLTDAIGNPTSEQAALQSMYENLFYLDIEVKNYKMASPAGHDPKFCVNSPAPCPGKDEFPLSRISREAIEANINAFTDLMYGFPDANQSRQGGFAALVRNFGEESIAARSEQLSRSIAQTFASDPDGFDALVQKQNAENCDLSQNSLLCKLRANIKQISKDFKTEYSRIMALTVPAGPQGDND